MKEAAFVRNEMLDQEPAPPSAVGVGHWLRENLFSSVPNTILTFLSLFLIYYVLSGILPWIFNGVWYADSLVECRRIFAERYGPGVEYGCWAVIRDRWDQIIFGFYQPEQYWRPILGWILIAVSIAPVLYPNLPRALYIVTVVTIFAYPWLIWGGSIWTPVSIALGFVAGYAGYRAVAALFGMLAGMIGSILVAFAWWIFAAGPVGAGLSEVLPIGIEAVRSRDLAGFVLSITIGVVAIVASLPIGIVLALGRQSDMLIVNKLSTGFIEFIRGVPLITLIFVATILLKFFLPRGMEIDVILSVIILVTLFTAAYIAEVVRAGLAAIPKGQYEAAAALGLDYPLAQRLVILPQALKIAIPGIVSNFISVFKDTTLVSIVALNDPLGIANAVRANSDWNGIVWELYGFIALIFFLFCFGMSRYSMSLERRLATDKR